MSGHIKGYVNGVIDGEFSGVIDGEMGAVVRAKDAVEQLREELPEGEVPEEPPQLEAVEIGGPGEAGNEWSRDTEAGAGLDGEVAETDTTVERGPEKEVAEPDNTRTGEAAEGGDFRRLVPEEDQETEGKGDIRDDAE